MENNNKLIAEFMGLEEIYTPLLNIYEISETETCLETDLAYHTDWNWLMPVVKKCREESNDEDSYWEAIYYSLVDLDIDNVYIAVVEFIKWYNENK
jgi:hypothetical protein